MILCEQQHSLFHPRVLCGNEKFYVFLRGKWERYQHGSIKSTTRTELSSGKNYYICIHRSFILCQFWSRIFSHGSIYDLAFKPDGSQLIVAAGNRVLVIYVFWFEINLDSEYFRDVLRKFFLGLRYKRWDTHSAPQRSQRNRVLCCILQRWYVWCLFCNSIAKITTLFREKNLFFFIKTTEVWCREI